MTCLGIYFVYQEYKPAITFATQGEDYKELMYQCDHAMREHYIAKKAVEFDANEMHIKNLQATELGLLQCHEYDKKRKELLANGLSPLRLILVELKKIFPALTNSG